ncbi:MAG: transcriptional repressor LexA [Proteobacteria bacterium]|nr:transcriptional repressor LexA [Pseudomonadota bacterium]
MARNLTRRQANVYRYIVDYIEENQYPPTIREIAEAFDIRSTNGVSEHLKALIRKGFLTKDSAKSRALRPLVPHEDIFVTSEDEDDEVLGTTVEAAVTSPSARGQRVEESECLRVRPIPVLGRIAAGNPILAEEHIEETLLLDAGIFCRGQDGVYALRVRGTSMIGDGIMPGDIVFIRPQETAENGELIAALVDGSATVKRYEKRQGVIYLIPSNPQMEPIVIHPGEVDEFRILGAIRGVLRQYA